MGLRILDDIVQTVGHVHQLQMKRAINSVGLNAGEGLFARGGNRTVRIESAMSSGREVIVGLRIAAAAGYLDAERVAREVDTIDRSSPLSTSWPTGSAERHQAAGLAPAA